MKSLVLKRIAAFTIDYLIIILYASLLFGIATVFQFRTTTPINGQLLGFTTLTLPVFCYFYFMESSYRATLGKQAVKIYVTSDKPKELVVRNILKFLPWEIAHTGVHWIVYYSQKGELTPNWVWVTLIIPQIIVLIYFISLIVYKGKHTLYDKVSKTEIRVT